MVEAARLAVVVEGDTRDLEADLKRAHAAVAGFGSGAVSALGGAAKAGGSLLESVSKLGIGVFGITQLGGAIGGLATGMVAGNAQMETYETQLATLMGSADKAKERLAELARFGAETPFELPEVVRAEKVLLGFGLTGQKALDLTGKTASQLRTVIGDVAAGTGASFEEIALNFGKFSAGATGEAISRFQELGIVTREQMSAMGVQFSKAGELISPLPQAMAAAVAIANQKFGGGMATLAKTFEGQMSTLSDNFNQAKNVITQPIFDVLKTAVAGLNDVLGGAGFQAVLQSVAQTLAGVVKRGVDLAGEGFDLFVAKVVPVARALGEALPGAIATAMGVLGPLAERVTTFFGSLAAGETLATTINRAFGDLIPAGLNPILDAVDQAFAAVKTTVAGLISTIETGGLAGLWEAVQKAMADFAPTGERIQRALEAVGTAVGALVPQPLTDFVASLLDAAKAAGTGESPMKKLADAVNAVSGAVEAAITFLTDHKLVLYALEGAVAALTAALVIQRGVMIATTIATDGLAVATAALNLVMSLNPIMLVVVALGALAGALVYAYQNSEEFRQVVDDTFAVLKQVVTIAVKQAQDYLGRLGRDLQTIGGWMSDLSATATLVFAAIAAAVTSAWDTISSATQTVFAAVKTAAETTWAAVSTTISTAVATARTAVETRLGQIEDLFAAARDAIAGIVEAIRSTVESVFGAVVAKAQESQRTLQGILETVQGWWRTIQDVIGAARTALGNLPSAPSGGGAAAPASPMPGGDATVPVAGLMARSAAAAAVVIQVQLPAGAYVGTVSEFARLVQPELERLVAVRTVI